MTDEFDSVARSGEESDVQAASRASRPEPLEWLRGLDEVEREELGALFVTCQGHVRALKDEHKAAEAAENAAFGLFRNNRGEAAGNARLTRTAVRRKEIDQHRKSRRSKLVQVEEFDAAGEDRAARRLEQLELIRLLMAHLPAEDQKVVESRDLESRDFADIAATLGKSEAAVRRQHSRAILKMRDVAERLGLAA